MTEAPQQQTIPDHLAGLRLDQALASMFPDYSRSRLKSWILQGYVTVDDRELRPKDAVHGGELVRLVPQPEVSVVSEAEPIPLQIAFEDEDLLVVNKPAGLVVHPGAGNTRGTMMNGLLDYLPAAAELPRAGIVHRLDKETSGLLLVGKNLKSHTALVRALAEREISRHYLAVCSGVLTGGGRIDAPIGRHPVDRLKMSVQENGRPAITHYRVLERFVVIMPSKPHRQSQPSPTPTSTPSCYGIYNHSNLPISAHMRYRARGAGPPILPVMGLPVGRMCAIEALRA